MSDRERRGDAPGDLILEPAERVLVATRPLFLWEPLVLIEILLVIGAKPREPFLERPGDRRGHRFPSELRKLFGQLASLGVLDIQAHRRSG